MAGHSKWSNIKNKKGKMDVKRGSIFTKIGREIAVAVKTGGPDPNTNARLRDVITKAKANNMPNDNINRSIKKASGELNSVNYEEMLYEGYAPSGIAVIVEALTDNKNRTAGEVRHAFDKNGGNLGTTGSVSYLFKKKGVIVIEKGDFTEDDIMMLILEVGGDDIITEDEVFEIHTMPQDFSAVKDVIEKAGCIILSSQVEYVPDDLITPNSDSVEQIQKLIDMLEDNDDVQNVYHNADLPMEEEEE
ncbi:MAG: YebC/PmpR family DNA-binding transcriptional regulator [Clostridiales bacterium]|nr:YebC/PmpR family DNA-binding transcriptional regulator [Clostridiales bacterium]